jgi:hypothetical protein
MKWSRRKVAVVGVLLVAAGAASYIWYWSVPSQPSVLGPTPTDYTWPESISCRPVPQTRQAECSAGRQLRDEYSLGTIFSGAMLGEGGPGGMSVGFGATGHQTGILLCNPPKGDRLRCRVWTGSGVNVTHEVASYDAA